MKPSQQKCSYEDSQKTGQEINGVSVGPFIHSWLSNTWPTLATYCPSAVHGAGVASAHYSLVTLSPPTCLI